MSDTNIIRVQGRDAFCQKLVTVVGENNIQGINRLPSKRESSK